MKLQSKKGHSLREDLRSIKRAFQTAHQLTPGLIGVSIGSALCASLSPFIGIYFSARILNELLGERDVTRLVTYVLLTIGLSLLAHLVSQSLIQTQRVKAERIFNVERIRVGEKYLQADYGNFENPDFQNMQRDYRETLNMGGPVFSYQFYHQVEQVIKGLFTIIFSVGMVYSLFAYSGDGSRFLTSFVPSILVIAAILAVSILSFLLSRKQVTKIGELTQQFIEKNRFFFFLFHLMDDYRLGKEIRLYQEKNLIRKRYNGVLGEGIKQTLDPMAQVNGRYGSLLSVLSVLLSGLIYLFVGLKAMLGVISVGMIVQYVGAINQFTSGFTTCAAAFNGLRQQTMFFAYYFNIIDTKPTKYEGHIPVEKRDDNDYEIEFRNVGFQYPGSSEWALRNLSLKLRIGEKMAVVGRNGSGKTTFIKLLCRLYDPTEGEILLNGIDIRKYDYEEYLSIFSVVFQDFRLFSFPLDQNVATSMELDEERVEECLKKAGFGDRLSSLPDGLSTPLYKDFDENGVEISGGEAQKIALARALYKDAPFIVLDEPTAALDPIAEYEIYSRFDELVGEKTAIYISHRLSSCRFCGDIAVFDHGELVQRGSHGELLAEEGSLYAQLWNAQAQYYEEQEETCSNVDYLP